MFRSSGPGAREIDGMQGASESVELDYRSVIEEEFDAVHIEINKDFEAWSSEKYPAKQHARRVAAELRKGSAVTDGIVYLPGLPTVDYEDSDQPPPLRQRRYFFYLTGANFHDCAVTYEINNDRLILWIPYVEPRQVLWYGSTPSTSRAMQLYDVDEARYSSQLPKFLETRLTSVSTLYLLHPEQVPPYTTAGKVDSSRLRPAMDWVRCFKDEYEIAMVRRANAVSSLAHRRVAQHLLQLTNEREMEAIFQAVCTSQGTRDQAYPVIAGAGENASTLHYGDNDQSLRGKELVVLDAGCEWNCYASDITRTLPISGAFSPRAAAIYAIVEEMQESCIEGVKPGVEMRDLQLLATDIGLRGLLKLGILRGDAAEIAAAGTMAAFFPHGLGHHVGLEVHDTPSGVPSNSQGLGLEGGKRQMVTPRMLSTMGSTGRAPSEAWQVLHPTMIFTVEPGIYFCREYIEGYFMNDPSHAGFIDRDVLEGYYSVGGVRIEDDVLVTEEGFENLTTAPKGDDLLAVING